MQSQLLILLHGVLPLPAAGFLPISPLFPKLSTILTFSFLGQLRCSRFWVRHGSSVTWQCCGYGAWLFLLPSPATEEGSELPDSDARWARGWAGAVGGKSWDPPGAHPSQSAPVGCRKRARFLYRIRIFIHKQTPYHKEVAR